jgi:hypothetical protein
MLTRAARGGEQVAQRGGASGEAGEVDAVQRKHGDVRTRVVSVAIVLVAVVVAVALRAWLLSSSVGRPDSDESVVGLMARAILHGQHPRFFWGQAYGGTIEPALVALSFAFTGTSTFGMKAVPLTLEIVAALLLWRVARRTVGVAAAPFAGALLLVYPPAFVWWSTKERGFYWAALVGVVAALLLALRLDSDRERPSTLDLMLFGLVFGLSWWTSPQTMFVMLPIAIWILVRARRHLSRWWIALAAAVVGALPWLEYNVRNSLASIRQPKAAQASTYWQRLHLFFAKLLPMTLGLRRPFTGTWLFGPVIGVVLYVAALGAFAWLALRVVRDASIRSEVGMYVAAGVAYPFLFAVPSTSYYVMDSRYGLMLTPVIIMLIAWAVRRSLAGRAVVMVLASILAFSMVAFTIDVANNNPFSVDLTPPRVQPLVHALDRAGVRDVYADYWIAYPLTFATKERIAASPVDAVRSASFAARAASAPHSTYVVFRGRPRDTALRQALEQRSVLFRHIDAGMFSVYLLDERMTPDALSSVWKIASP